jgi:hypothetical protein
MDSFGVFQTLEEPVRACRKIIQFKDYSVRSVKIRRSTISKSDNSAPEMCHTRGDDPW